MDEVRISSHSRGVTVLAQARPKIIRALALGLSKAEVSFPEIRLVAIDTVMIGEECCMVQR
jgi:hypothetical protein